MITDTTETRPTIKSLDKDLQRHGIRTTNIGDRKTKEKLLESINERETKYPMNIEFEIGSLTQILEEKRKIFVQEKGSTI